MSATTLRNHLLDYKARSVNSSPMHSTCDGFRLTRRVSPLLTVSRKVGALPPNLEAKSTTLTDPKKVEMIKELVSEIVNDPSKSGYLTSITQRTLIRMVNKSQSSTSATDRFFMTTHENSQMASKSIWKPKLKERRGLAKTATTLNLKSLVHQGSAQENHMDFTPTFGTPAYFVSPTQQNKQKTLKRAQSISKSSQQSDQLLSRLPSGGKLLDMSSFNENIISERNFTLQDTQPEQNSQKHNNLIKVVDKQTDERVQLKTQGTVQLDVSSSEQQDVTHVQLAKQASKPVYHGGQPSKDTHVSEGSNFERRVPDYRSLKGITTHFLFEKYPMVQFNTSLFKNPISNNFLLAQQCHIAHSEMYRMCHSLKTAQNLDALYGNRHYLELLQTVNLLNERCIAIIYRICFEILPNTLAGLITKGFVKDPMVIEPDCSPDNEMGIFFKNRTFLKRMVQFYESCVYHFNLLLKDNMAEQQRVTQYNLIMRMFERLRFDIAKASNLYTRLSEELTQKEPSWAVQNYVISFDGEGDYKTHAMTIRGCLERVGHHIFGNKHHLNHSEAFRIQKQTQRRLRQAQSQSKMHSPGKKYTLAHNFDKYERPEILQLLDAQLYKDDEQEGTETKDKRVSTQDKKIVRGKHAALTHLLSYFRSKES